MCVAVLPSLVINRQGGQCRLSAEPLFPLALVAKNVGPMLLGPSANKVAKTTEAQHCRDDDSEYEYSFKHV